jgi:hypothetical protein
MGRRESTVIRVRDFVGRFLSTQTGCTAVWVGRVSMQAEFIGMRAGCTDVSIGRPGAYSGELK